MKKIILLLLIIFTVNETFAQTDYSGSYSFQEKVNYQKGDKMKPGKEDQGRGGSLKLFKLDDGRYKFWLSLSKGWPSYNMGEVDGFISVVNNKATFSEKNEYSEGDCKIVFTFSNGSVKIEQMSTDSECGFGMGVYADGDYKVKSAGKMKNVELEKMNIGLHCLK